MIQGSKGQNSFLLAGYGFRMCVELRELRSNGAIRVSNEGQNTF